jgi:putative DNA primase/helicase
MSQPTAKKTTTEENILSEAHKLYKLGLNIIPIVRGKKTPAFPWKPFQVTRSNKRTIESWFKEPSKYDLGIVTGSVSKITVIDADSQEASQKIEALLEEITPQAQTPRGGRHFYFAYDPDLKTSTDPSLEIDVRNDGGIVVCPPTARNGEGYVWLIKPTENFPVIPPKLKAMLIKPPPPPTNPGPPTEDKLDMGKYLTHYGIKFEIKEGDGCRIYQLYKCPFSENHTEGDGLGHAVIVQRDDGLLTFHCKHAHCSDKTWIDAREAISGKDKLTPPTLMLSRAEARIIQKLKLTDAGIAEAFDELYGEDFRFMQEPSDAPQSVKKGIWIFYNNCKWESISEAEIRSLVLNIVRAKEMVLLSWVTMGEEEAKVRRKMLDRCLSFEQDIKQFGILNQIKAQTNILSDRFDQDAWLLGCENAVIDLRKGEKRAFVNENGQPVKNYIFKSTSVEYNPDAKCPRWERFLDEIFLGDLDLIDYIQMVIGYCLTGCGDEQCFFILYGDSENGKSTFLEVILRIMRDYGQSAEFKTFCEKREDRTPGRPTSEVWRMRGKRFIRATEIDQTVALNTSRIKSFTGGETVTGRDLYHSDGDFLYTAKVFLGVNHPPIIREMEPAFERRIHFIPFKAHFPKGSPQRDGRLQEKLLAEKSGILNWAIFGCLKYQWAVEKFGSLPMPKIVETETAKYILAQDPIRRFLRDKIETKPGSEIGAQLLYETYIQWCSKGNETESNSTVFGRRLRSLGHEKKDKASGAFYQNLRFKVP